MSRSLICDRDRELKIKVRLHHRTRSIKCRESIAAGINGKHVRKSVFRRIYIPDDATIILPRTSAHGTRQMKIEVVTEASLSINLLLFLHLIAGWLGALSTAVALFISPLTIGVCKRKSTRLTAVIGGLVT